MLFLLIGARKVPVFTLDEAARVLDCSADYVRALRKRGKLKSHRYNGAHYYDQRSVYAYKMRHPRLGKSRWINRRVAV